jgi:hypothetical protein
LPPSQDTPIGTRRFSRLSAEESALPRRYASALLNPGMKRFPSLRESALLCVRQAVQRFRGG